MIVSTVLKGGRVVDPSQGIDRIADVELRDGNVYEIGSGLAGAANADIVDVSGLIVTPGLIDIHVHAYGSLGFAFPDSIGIYQGVTTFVEAGGPGPASFDQFRALMEGSTITDLFAGVYLRPLGILGVDYIEGDIAGLGTVDVPAWLELMEGNRDLIKYLKIGAFGNYGAGPLYLAKGIAEIIGIPTYTHIGDHQVEPDRITTSRAFDIAGAGDIITHIYHNNPGSIIDETGKVRPEVLAAHKRGALFDIGFGALNFSFDIAEQALRQDVVPDIISSDLQQFNVLGPTHSFAHVLSAFLPLGFSLTEIIERATSAPARALRMDDRGSLTPGKIADVSVFEMREGDFEITDCYGGSRKSTARLVPVMAFKAGKRTDCDLSLCEDEGNWLPFVCEDFLPQGVQSLDRAQRHFLSGFRQELQQLEWQTKVNIPQMQALEHAFRKVAHGHGIPMRNALQAVYKCFLEKPFTCQLGLFVNRLNRDFVLDRLGVVAVQE